MTRAVTTASVPPPRAAAEPLEIGAPAPDFDLPDQHGQRVRLAEYRGRMDVVLVFFPFAFTRVCTQEMAALRDALPRLGRVEVELLAVSCDSMYTLRAFADHDRLPLRLLADFWPHGVVSGRYGVFDAGRGCAERATFIVDRAGTVRWRVLNKMPDARNVDDYVKVLDEIAG